MNGVSLTKGKKNLLSVLEYTYLFKVWYYFISVDSWKAFSFKPSLFANNNACRSIFLVPWRKILAFERKLQEDNQIWFDLWYLIRFFLCVDWFFFIVQKKKQFSVICAININYCFDFALDQFFFFFALRRKRKGD